MGDFYDDNAAEYAEATRELDVSALRGRFLARVPAGGHILDAGCGSGRDSGAFLRAGYRVTAFDQSERLAALASEHIGQPVRAMGFAEVDWTESFDGVWACASLLHVPWAELPDAVSRLARSLKPGGILYMSFKHGTGPRWERGRFFQDLDEAGLERLLAAVPALSLIEQWRSDDVRPGCPDSAWLNALLRKD